MIYTEVSDAKVHESKVSHYLGKMDRQTDRQTNKRIWREYWSLPWKIAVITCWVGYRSDISYWSTGRHINYNAYWTCCAYTA